MYNYCYRELINQGFWREIQINQCVIFLYYLQVVTTLMGTGDSRDLSCTSISCSNGQAVKQKLLAPKALASSPDGAIYVADYNLIRKITPDGLVSSLLKLK